MKIFCKYFGVSMLNKLSNFSFLGAAREFDWVPPLIFARLHGRQHYMGRKLKIRNWGVSSSQGLSGCAHGNNLADGLSDIIHLYIFYAVSLFYKEFWYWNLYETVNQASVLIFFAIYCQLLFVGTLHITIGSIVYKSCG